MRELNLDDNNLHNISSLVYVLRALPHLKKLSLRQNQITDPSALTQLTQLEGLNLAQNNITSISDLCQMHQLHEINLSRNQLTDIAPIAQLTNLNRLALGNNDISNITALRNLTNLMSLEISDNHIDSVAPLANLSHLIVLDLDNNKIVNIRELSHLINLKKLHLSNNPRENEPLAKQYLTRLSETLKACINNNILPDHLADAAKQLLKEIGKRSDFIRDNPDPTKENYIDQLKKHIDVFDINTIKNQIELLDYIVKNLDHLNHLLTSLFENNYKINLINVPTGPKG